MRPGKERWVKNTTYSRDEDRLCEMGVREVVVGRAVILNRCLGKSSPTHPAAGTCKPASEKSGATAREARPESTAVLSAQGYLFNPLSLLGSREPWSVLKQRSTMCGKMSLVALQSMGYSGWD